MHFEYACNARYYSAAISERYQGLRATLGFETWTDRSRAATRDTIGNFGEELE